MKNENENVQKINNKSNEEKIMITIIKQSYPKD